MSETDQILIVEDDPEVRRFLVEFLEEEGYHVGQASDGADAISQASTSRPRLLVLDMMLPDMTGDEVVQRLQANGIDLPILVVTANGRAKESAEAVGAYGYLSKPFELDAFLGAVVRGLALPAALNS